MVDTTVLSSPRKRVAQLIIILSFAHFSHHVLTALLVPLLPFIRTEFDLSYAQTGFVSAMFTIAYGIAQIPCGWLADRAGPRYLLLASIAGLAVVGALIGVSVSYFSLLAFLFLMGVLGGGYHPAAALAISRSVTAERRGKALGFHIVGGSASHFIAPLIAAGLVAAVGWRATYPLLAVPVFATGLVVFAVLHRRRNDSALHSNGAETGTEEVSESSRPVAEIALFLVLAGLVGAGAASLISFLPLYLVDDRGIDPRLAAAMLSIVYSAGFWAAPVGGHLSDRLGRVRVMAVLGISMGPIFLLLPSVPSGVALVAFLLLIGAIMFTKMPTAEAYISGAVHPKKRATVLGIYFFTGVEVGAILTPIIGDSIDSHGFAGGFRRTGVALLVVAVCSAVPMILLRIRNRNARVDPAS